MPNSFAELEEKQAFCDAVCDAFKLSPTEIAAIMNSAHSIERERAEYAHDEYMQSIKRFALYLDSADPDHYKRSGALLHALATSKIITDVKLEYSAEDLEGGMTRVTLGDAKHYLPFVEFYEVYHNQLAAFQFAWRVCAMYEDNPVVPDMDYILNICRFLKCEPNLSVDMCFMLLKSLMVK